MALPCPKTLEGFIDKEKLFQLIVGELQLCSLLEYESFCDVATPKQINLLAEEQLERNKNHYELIAVAVKIGYINAKQGKKYNIFESTSNKQDNKPKFIDPQDKQEQLESLKESF